jgi:hypothetical protein
MGRLEPSDADAGLYYSVQDLFHAFAEIYDLEEKRVAAINGYLSTLCNGPFVNVVV